MRTISGTPTEAAASDASVLVTISVTDVNEPPYQLDAPTVSYSSGGANSNRADINTASASQTAALAVSWTPSDMTGKPPITDYDVQYRLSGSGEVG